MSKNIVIIMIFFSNLGFSQQHITSDTIGGVIFEYRVIIKKNDTIKKGKYYLYNLNKELIETGKYKNNLKQGRIKSFNQKGELFQKYRVKKGVLNGKSKEYYSVGGIYKKGKYKNGNKIGKWITYTKEKKIMAIGEFLGKTYFIKRKDSLILVYDKKGDTVNVFLASTNDLYNTFGVFSAEKIYLKKGVWIYKDKDYYINKREVYNSNGELIDYILFREKSSEIPPIIKTPSPHR